MKKNKIVKRLPTKQELERIAERVGVEAFRAWAEKIYKNLAKQAHPDNGGSVDEMQRLNQLRDEYLENVRRITKKNV